MLVKTSLWSKEYSNKEKNGMMSNQSQDLVPQR